MRFLFKLLLLFIVLTPIAAIVAVGLSIEDQPLVASTSALPPNAIRRARTIVRAHDPRRLPEGAVRTVRLRQRDLELAINYLAREFGAGGAKVSIDTAVLGLQMTALLPIKGDSGKRYYINLDLQLDEQPNAIPKVAALRLGKMKIPGVVADFALDYWLRHGPGATPERPLIALVRAVKMRPRQLAITYQWQPELLSDLRASVLPESDRRRLRDYHEQLVESVAKLPHNVSVARLLQPMFKFAKSRSAGGDAIAENRAAIIVLSTFGAGRSLGSLVPEAKSWPRPQKRRLTLRGRRDFTQHFLTSAGLVVFGGNRFSDVVGLAKEVDDAGFGSGFSFPDITADRAGTRFAETALHSQASAKQLQHQLAAGVKDAALMPSVRGMPEFMDKAEFARRFERIGSSAYNKMMATIEQRLDAVRLYQSASG